ncbi:glycosyltransferase involved in cell wall biosynthesis [Chitinophaga terrae (ex Kim and Jung 2007)]|uniref:glycosyltransferase family 4 protein n=1 Tax=Chitinophaga terrae (ex Kim and Jung 2007) TaxID=408074 RepID=UPI002789C094|nr:glycosyltransferase family 4 protein [Chitinophaga terrae (ex Kim and Jung 2007)]MDQ0105769.1 glycosyltransferase involved in cell wall biosynthesis [Chitinophaga terrae (ex Kim and Jung 2007)]
MVGSENRRIIFITHYTELYGANKSMLDLIRGLSGKADVEVLLIVPGEGKITKLAQQEGINYLILPFYNEIYFSADNGFVSTCKGFFKLLCNLTLAFRHRALFRHPGTVIHSNSSATLIGSYFSLVSGKPHVWHIREFGWEDYRIRYCFGTRYFNMLLNRSAAVIAISKAIYSARVEHSAARRKQVIYNGVLYGAAAQGKAPRAWSFEEGKKKMVFAVIGYISPEKGQHEAIKAFSIFVEKHPQAELRIIGVGEEKYVSELKGISSGLGLNNNIIFTGHVENMDKAYHEIDVLLMCSRSEAFGRVTVEAMSNGIPVIGFENGGTAEIITDGINGLLYRKGAAELGEKMALLCRDAALYEELSQNAFNNVYQQFSVEKYVEAVKAVYLALPENE